MPKDGAADAQIETAASYPGASASYIDILDLAHGYYNAAVHLFERFEGWNHFAQAPARLCAIHAIELYLNAFLRHSGVPFEDIPKRHRLDDANFAETLKLKRSTQKHLLWITENREYLISRYGPEQLKLQSQVSQLRKTLVEVMLKAGEYLS